MFGLSFGELMVLLVVAVVVLGPKELPRYLRKAGEMAGRLRRLAFEMREKSGIDEVLRTEGIDRDIAEIRRLARGEIGQVAAAVRSTTDALRPAAASASTAALLPKPGAAAAAPSPNSAATGTGAEAAAPTVLAGEPVAAAARFPVSGTDPQVSREREYPREGADSYGALPDSAVVYDGSLPASPLADDALYTRGEAA